MRGYPKGGMRPPLCRCGRRFLGGGHSRKCPPPKRAFAYFSHEGKVGRGPGVKSPRGCESNRSDSGEEMLPSLPPGDTRIGPVAARCTGSASSKKREGGGEAPENKKKERLLPLLLNISLPRLGLAVQAAVDPALPVGELEHLGQL